MPNNDLREEILRNIKFGRINKNEKNKEVMEKELTSVEYTIAALRGLILNQFRNCSSLNQIEYEYRTTFWTKTREFSKPHIKFHFPNVYFQFSNYTEFYSVADGYGNERFFWDDERITEHQFTSTVEAMRHIIRVLYDELYNEGILFVIESRNDEALPSLKHEIISYERLIRIMKKCADRYPFNSLYPIGLLLYLEKQEN